MTKILCLGLFVGLFSNFAEAKNTPPTQVMSVFFGSAFVGSFTDQVVRVTNDGKGDLGVASAQVEGIDFAATTNCPAALKPKQHCDIYLRFWPQFPGFEVGEFLMTFSDGSGLQLELSGTGLPIRD